MYSLKWNIWCLHINFCIKDNNWSIYSTYYINVHTISAFIIQLWTNNVNLQPTFLTKIKKNICGFANTIWKFERQCLPQSLATNWWLNVNHMKKLKRNSIASIESIKQKSDECVCIGTFRCFHLAQSKQNNKHAQLALLCGRETKFNALITSMPFLTGQLKTT